MEILIIGAGALGGIFGAALQVSGHSVTYYDIDQNKTDILNRQGFCIKEQDSTEITIPARAISLIEDATPPALALVLVKAYSVAQAARELSLIKTPATQVLALQNGLGHVARMAQYLDRGQIFSGVTYQAAYEIAPGHICHSANGLTTLAPLEKSSQSQAMDIARLLNNSRIPAAASTDVRPIRWKKLIVNSAINPLSAIHRLPNGQLPQNPLIARDMMRIVMEGVAVAQEEGMPLNYGEMWAAVLETCRATAHNRSSMLADVEKGLMTEIEAINGSLVRLGERHGVDTPVNARMVRGVVAIHGRNDRIRLDL